MREHRQNWRDIFSCFRVALDVRKIVLGTLGVYISALVIYLLMLACCTPDTQMTFMDMLRHPTYGLDMMFGWFRGMPHSCAANIHSIGFGSAAFMGAVAVMMLAIWSFFGGAIARLAAVDFAKGERMEIGQAAAFTCRKFGSFFWAPVAPLIFVAILLLCNYVLGLLGRIPGAGPIIVGLLFFLAALSSFFIIILLIGTYFGFPFMWPTIAMEGTDAFDAISRSFNYLFARPWKTLWCWLVALVYGAVTTAFVGYFLLALVWIAKASVATGMGDKFGPIGEFFQSGTPPENAALPMIIAMVLFRVLIILAIGLFLGYMASFKMTAFTVIYSIIRRDVDGTDMSEAYLPEQTEAAAAQPEKPQPPAEQA